MAWPRSAMPTAPRRQGIPQKPEAFARRLKAGDDPVQAALHAKARGVGAATDQLETGAATSRRLGKSPVGELTPTGSGVVDRKAADFTPSKGSQIGKGRDAPVLRPGDQGYPDSEFELLPIEHTNRTGKKSMRAYPRKNRTKHEIRRQYVKGDNGITKPLPLQSEEQIDRIKPNPDGTFWLYRQGRKQLFDDKSLPVFDSVVQVRLPNSQLKNKSRDFHAREANRILSAKSEDWLRKRGFTPDDIKKIGALDTPNGYIWHHDARTGNLQLVDQIQHHTFTHIGLVGPHSSE